MTDTPTSGTVSVSREWLSDLQTFLEEAYDGGIGGLIQEECGNQLVELRAILAQPAEQQDEPVAFALPQFLNATPEMVERGVNAWRRANEDGCHGYNSVFYAAFNAAIQVWLDDQHELIESGAYRHPAASAVKLPERMPTGNITVPHHDLPPGVREGFNLCLDAVAKLNGIEP